MCSLWVLSDLTVECQAKSDSLDWAKNVQKALHWFCLNLMHPWPRTLTSFINGAKATVSGHGQNLKKSRAGICLIKLSLCLLSEEESADSREEWTQCPDHGCAHTKDVGLTLAVLLQRLLNCNYYGLSS